MLRRLATTPKWQHAVQQRRAIILKPQSLACLSTAPRPANPSPPQQQQQPISLSYQEWAARNAAAQALNVRQHSPPQKSTSSQQRRRRSKPQKYNSLVYLPDTVTLKFPTSYGNNANHDFRLECVDFAIAKPGKGGHAILGRNGSGKSLLVQQLTTRNTDDNSNGGSSSWTLPSSKDDIGYVSFDSHIQVLQDHPHRTVHESITGGKGNLSKAAQYLVVRFGLFPLLGRTLSTLSTGEIRKALLVSELAKQPKLLVLENAFDGLDVTSRNELRSIVSKTIEGLGKSGKLLVQSVNADYVPPAQVLLSTHRPEEIGNEISTISYIEQQPTRNDSLVNKNNNTLWTMERPTNYSQEQIMFTALGLDKDHNKNTQNWSVVAPWDDNDPTLPSLEEIQQVWPAGGGGVAEDTLLSLDDVTIRRRRDGAAAAAAAAHVESEEEEEEASESAAPDDDSQYATLLHSLTWDIEKGQRWLISGSNGAGKSTLTRFLLPQQTNQSPAIKADNDDANAVVEDTTKDMISGSHVTKDDTTIGWVSTESHLVQMTTTTTTSSTNDERTASTAWDVICHNGEVSVEVAETMTQWVFGGCNNNDDHNMMVNKLKDRTMSELSQGEQKLTLIAAALAVRPKLLILDEPTQGLDWVHRRRILSLLERLCEANPDLSLAFITHYQEEWIPSISHVLHLEKGHVLYQGGRKQYKPNKLW